MSGVLGKFFAGIAGVLFGAGLLVSGMTKPGKVVGFLDAFGDWDASLAFVMLGAIGVHFFVHRLALRRASPLFATQFRLPTRSDVDRRLVAGAAVFGIGWGLAGYCPGPGLVSVASGALSPVLFVAAMTVGMKIEAVLAGVMRPPSR
jgi:uncharacterized membrane protein YedE/YeeE